MKHKTECKGAKCKGVKVQKQKRTQNKKTGGPQTLLYDYNNTFFSGVEAGFKPALFLTSLITKKQEGHRPSSTITTTRFFPA